MYEIGGYKKEIEELKLQSPPGRVPKERCIQVSRTRAGALEELREGLEGWREKRAVKVVTP